MESGGSHGDGRLHPGRAYGPVPSASISSWGLGEGGFGSELAAAYKNNWLTIPWQFFYSHIWTPRPASVLLTNEWYLLRVRHLEGIESSNWCPCSFLRMLSASYQVTPPSSQPWHPPTTQTHTHTHSILCVISLCLRSTKLSQFPDTEKLLHLPLLLPSPLETLNSLILAFLAPLLAGSGTMKFWQIKNKRETRGSLLPGSFFWRIGFCLFLSLIKDRRQIRKALSYHLASLDSFCSQWLYKT